MPDTLARLLEPTELEKHLNDDHLLIIDLCKEQLYQRAHIPGAIHISPSQLMRGEAPAPGKLPDAERLSTLFSRLGLTAQTHVVAYDDEGGGWAGRLLWTLDVIGHARWSYLNGGLVAWQNEGHPLTSAIPPAPIRTAVTVNPDRSQLVEAEDIISHLGAKNFVIWDARTREEYDGIRVLSQRGGHIPGAIHCEWTSLMDRTRNMRVRADARTYLQQLGLTSDKTIITHCQSHHRSAYTYLVGKLLDYENIRGYHGSWSEWGNLPNTPIEI